MGAFGVMTLDEAYAAIDYRTIILLFGMMILIASLRLARAFGRLAVSVSRIPKPVLLLVAVGSSAARCRRSSSTTRSAWCSRRSSSIWPAHVDRIRCRSC